MGVRVDESRHHHFAGGVDVRGGASLRQILQAPRGADLVDDPVFQQQRAVGNDAEISRGRAAARTAGPAQGDQLPRRADENCGSDGLTVPLGLSCGR
jgi:hypothetical protein